MGKVAVVGMKDRETNRVSAEVIESADGLTLQGFVLDQVALAQRSTRTITGAITDSRTTRLSNTAWASTWMAWRTPTGSSHFGPC